MHIVDATIAHPVSAYGRVEEQTDAVKEPVRAGKDQTLQRSGEQSAEGRDARGTSGRGEVEVPVFASKRQP